MRKRKYEEPFEIYIYHQTISESTRQMFVICLELAKNKTFEDFPAEYAKPGNPETLPVRFAALMIYVTDQIKKISDCEESIQIKELFNKQVDELTELLDVIAEMPNSALTFFLANHKPEINPNVYLDIQNAMNGTQA